MKKQTLKISVFLITVFMISVASAQHLDCIAGTEVVVSGGKFQPLILARDVSEKSKIPTTFVRWLDEDHALFRIDTFEFYSAFESYLTEKGIKFGRIITENGNPVYSLTEFSDWSPEEIDRMSIVRQVTALIGIPIVSIHSDEERVVIAPASTQIINIYMNTLRELSGGQVDKVQWSSGFCN